MYNAGDFDTTETVDIPFSTFDSNDPSASVTITNLAAGDLHIHKNGGVTQRSSSSGVTISIDFDGITGNHIAHVDLSDDTDAGFYVAGSRYLIRMEGTTVDAATVNAWLGGWSVGLTPAVDASGRTDVGAWLGTAVTTSATSTLPEVDAKSISDSAGAANSVEANIANLDASVAAIPTTAMRGTDSAATATALATAQLDLDTLTGADGATLATVQGNYAPAVAGDAMTMDDWLDGGRLDLILDARAAQTTADAIETDTQDLQSRLPAALVGARMDATVDATGMESGAVSNILTTTMTESYVANGAPGSLAQMTYAIHQMLMDFGISGTSLTVRKLDGVTTAFVVTLDDAAKPTDVRRA